MTPGPTRTQGLPTLEDGRSYKYQDQCIADAIAAVARENSQSIRILEAGCGNAWPVSLGDFDYRIIGLDLDAAALQIRINVKKDLDEAIHGDLCTVELPPESFDVVYCAYVLEHIPAADVALRNLTRTLKPGGLLVVRVPDPETARAVVTKLTPFWFHVLYYRWVMKRPNAGKPGYAPYETHYHPIISWAGISTFARTNGLDCTARYADTFVRDGRGIGGVIFRLGARAIDILTAGRYTSRYNDVIYLLRKRVTRTSDPAVPALGSFPQEGPHCILDQPRSPTPTPPGADATSGGEANRSRCSSRHLASRTRPLYSNVHWTFRRLLHRAGLAPHTRSCRPRIQDILHSFAIRSMIDACRHRADAD